MRDTVRNITVSLTGVLATLVSCDNLRVFIVYDIKRVINDPAFEN